MSKLRISDAPLLPDVDGTEKIPTGGRGDYAISVDQIKDHIFQDVGKELVGLGNVDNTSDLDKPVSTAQQAALNLKADKTYVDTNLDLKADKTSVYTRSETTLALSQKADLVGGVIPSNQLPSYVDDVVEYTTNTLPIIGEGGKIYVTTDTNRTWRWSGNQYVEISNGGISDSTLKLQTPRKIADVDFDGTQNINIPHNNLVNRDVSGAHPASAILDESGKTQQEINDFGGSLWRSKPNGYKFGATVKLETGEIVRSTIPDNMSDPNLNMTGWVSISDQIVLNSISELVFSNYNFKSVLVRSYHADLNLGGGVFYWDETGNKNKHNGGTIIDPSKTFPTDWSDQAQLASWFTANPNGSGVWRKVLLADPSILDFGAVGDGTTDDTKAIQSAVNSGLKKINVHEGVSTIYKLTDSVRISTAGLTLSWDSNLIKFKKFYSPLNSTPAGGGSLISVAAAAVLLENVGLDGNAGSYGGCGIVYESAALYYTYGCRITNPDIRNTKDSCVIFKGSRGAPDIVISGGTMFTWQDPAYAGASSCGYPAIRIVGELDTGGPAPRVFDGVNASSTILLDATGMNGFKVDNCFTGTILYQGNPDVTGGTNPYRTGQGAVTNTYVRDGLVVAGFENSIDTSLSHGHAPLVWDKYGGKPTVFSEFGWEISANSVATKLGSSNVVSYQIKDDSPQGLATLNISSLYTEEIPFLPEWKGYTSNPSIGNGSLVAAYDNVGKFLNFRMKLTIGSTTSRGTGEWSFTLPKWSNIAFGGHGVWSCYIVGVGRMSGAVVIYNNGAVHEIALLSSDGSAVIGSGNPANLPAGSIFNVSFYYLRG